LVAGKASAAAEVGSVGSTGRFLRGTGPFLWGSQTKLERNLHNPFMGLGYPAGQLFDHKPISTTEVAVSNRTITVSTIVLVVLFALTAAARFVVQAFATPMGYGIRRGFEGFRGQMGPGMMGGFHAPMAYGQGWFYALTSFGMWVFPIMLLGLLIVAIAQRRNPEPQEDPEPKGKSK
jgi:hypothetical protein